MKVLKKVIAILCAAAVPVCGSAAAYANVDITVMAHSLKGTAPEIISFDDHEPVQRNNTTLVPVRDLAAAAGIDVEWDQPTQTATLTLLADASSQEPAKQYAAKVIDKVGGYGLELEPVSISAALKLDDKYATLRYNFMDTDGDIVSIGKAVEMESPATLVEDSSLMVPVRDTMELFGLEVVWNQSTMAVKISVPDYVITPKGLGIMADSKKEISATETVSYDVQEDSAPIETSGQHGAYIGRFKITHYCPCSICNGGYGAHTAWAGGINPGVTIAVNPDIIPPLSWVYVEGYGLRRAEDTGGGIGEYHIDMAVPTHAMAMQLGVVYKDVYWAE